MGMGTPVDNHIVISKKMLRDSPHVAQTIMKAQAKDLKQLLIEE